MSDWQSTGIKKTRRDEDRNTNTNTMYVCLFVCSFVHGFQIGPFMVLGTKAHLFALSLETGTLSKA